MIGARMDQPGATMPLTHAGGYQAAGFALVALVDLDAEARAAAKCWGGEIYADFDEMMRGAKPEVLSIAVPTAVRARLLQQALQYKPRAVVAEKPLASTVAESEGVVSAYSRAGVPLMVNYSRRYTSLWRRMRGSQAMTTTIRYAKGVRHNGTHAIDLCRMMFGECTSAMSLAKKLDCWPDDPTVSGFLTFERCPEVFLQSLDERCFTLFEVDIVASTWRLIVDSDGRRARRFELRNDVGIPPGRRLLGSGTEETGAGSAMLNLMQNLREVLEGAAPACSGEDALAAQRIAEQLSE